MRVILFALLAAACGSAPTSDDAAKKELKRFQGEWTLVDGQNLNGDALDKSATMVIKGNKFTINMDTEGTFTIDPAKQTIDVSVTKPAQLKFIGIYQIDGDTRKSCFVEDGTPRPDKMRRGRGFLTFQWKRAK